VALILTISTAERMSLTLSLYNLIYPNNNEESESTLLTLHSPIDYRLADQNGDCQGPKLMLNAYNKSYMFGPEGMVKSGATQSYEGNKELNTTRLGLSVNNTMESHLRLP